jgi:alpha-amylase
MLLVLLLEVVILKKFLAYSHSGVSVQLFEWYFVSFGKYLNCRTIYRPWEDIANECEEFLGPKGYKSVQISPPTEHIQVQQLTIIFYYFFNNFYLKGSQWWTRYQPVTYSLISRSGNESQFINMVNRCKAVNVAIIVDAVINHMAAGSGTSIAGSKYGGRSFPFYSPEDFHHSENNLYANCQVSNYSSQQNVQSCDLSNLPDLCTSCPWVRQQVAALLDRLAELGAAGVRVDAAKHMDDQELSQILSLRPPSLWVGQEVIGGQGEAVQPDMYYGTGNVTEFYYADYLDDNIVPLGKMKYLQTFGEAWGLMPDKYAIAFLDK